MTSKSAIVDVLAAHPGSDSVCPKKPTRLIRAQNHVFGDQLLRKVTHAVYQTGWKFREEPGFRSQGTTLQQNPPRINFL